MSSLKLTQYRDALKRLESRYQELIRKGFKTKDLSVVQCGKLRELREKDVEFVLSHEPLDFLKIHNWEKEWNQFFDWILSESV